MVVFFYVRIRWLFFLFLAKIELQTHFSLWLGTEKTRIILLKDSFLHTISFSRIFVETSTTEGKHLVNNSFDAVLILHGIKA